MTENNGDTEGRRSIPEVSTTQPSTTNISTNPLITGLDDKNNYDATVQPTDIGSERRAVRSSQETEDSIIRAMDDLELKSKRSWFAYLKTRDFLIVLFLGYVFNCSFSITKAIR